MPLRHPFLTQTDTPIRIIKTLTPNSRLLSTFPEAQQHARVRLAHGCAQVPVTVMRGADRDDVGLGFEGDEEHRPGLDRPDRFVDIELPAAAADLGAADPGNLAAPDRVARSGDTVDLLSDGGHVVGVVLTNRREVPYKFATSV